MATNDTSRRIILATFLLLISFFHRHRISASTLNQPGRICVGSDVDCTELKQLTRGSLTCVPTRDRVDCLKKLKNGQADYGYFEAEDQRMASHLEVDLDAHLTFSTGKEVREVYLLVHNVSNTNPRTLCHPGFQRARFFPRALYTPTTLNTTEPTGDIQKLIISLSQAWDRACLPGPWSPDPVTDGHLKRDHPQLCSLCSKENCDADDPRAGTGALTCVLEKLADAAFVSDVELKKTRDQNPAVGKLYHYCAGRDIPIYPLAGKEEKQPCNWGERPLPVLMSLRCSNEECRANQRRWFKAMTSNLSALKGVLDLPRSAKILEVEDSSIPEALPISIPLHHKKLTLRDHITLSVHTKTEEDKCQDLALALSGYSSDDSVGIKCRLEEDKAKATSNIYFGLADAVALDSGDVYQVIQDYGFQRILSEVYDASSSAPTSSFYAVAVVRAESNITSFEHLRGRASCHTGVGRTEGWKVPVATLLEQRLIDPDHCNYVSAVAEFFSAGSCAPGAKSVEYNKQQSYVGRLCRLCRGEGSTHCARNSDEPFYSFEGALRCLVHGGGDVAFVKHTTVPLFTGGTTSASWAVGLQADQFRLLCPSGGTAAVTDYDKCNLALVPAHEVVVSERISSERKQLIQETLLGISEVFNVDSSGSKTFRLFGSYHGSTDLLFKDTAVSLRALSEDSPDQRESKKNYFRRLDEMHTCEVRVCALEGQLEDCRAMARMMLTEGQTFVCVSARDRMDCIYRIMRGQVDMAPLPGRYLGINPNLRVFAVVKDPVKAMDQFREKMVAVVRRSTIKRLGDLKGKKSCHGGFGDSAGWKVPMALLKRGGIIYPPCNNYQSAAEHEIVAAATTFNRACVPGQWVVSNLTDAALKGRYKAMCSMCSSGTCDRRDRYAGNQGALRCLTQKRADVAFTTLSDVREFFSMSHSLNKDIYGLLCLNGRIVNFTTADAEACYWAAQPWDTYVTHGAASDSKVQKLFWALTKAKIKGEEDMESRKWYFTSLGLGAAKDVLPVMDNISTRQFYAKTRLDIVEAEEMCKEKPVRLCVRSDLEERKCNELRSVMNLIGTSPALFCVRGTDTEDCVNRISLDKADVISLDDVTRFEFHEKYSLTNLITENYGSAENTKYYLLAVVRRSDDLTSIADLPGKTTCHFSDNTTTIDYTLTQCLSGGSDFYDNFVDALVCLVSSDKDVAFVKLPFEGKFAGEYIPEDVDIDDFGLLCKDSVMPLQSSSVPECNLGRVPADMVVTRQSEVSSRRQDMLHVLLRAGEEFGQLNSFFRLFHEYYNESNLLFKDETTHLTPLPDEHYQTFVTTMWQQACHLYDHHLKKSSYQ